MANWYDCSRYFSLSVGNLLPFIHPTIGGWNRMPYKLGKLEMALEQSNKVWLSKRARGNPLRETLSLEKVKNWWKQRAQAGNFLANFPRLL